MVSVPVCIACLMPTMASVSWACEDDKTSDDDPDQAWLSIFPAAAESETDESKDEHDESNDDTAQGDGNDDDDDGDDSPSGVAGSMSMPPVVRHYACPMGPMDKPPPSTACTAKKSMPPVWEKTGLRRCLLKKNTGLTAMQTNQ